MKLREPEGYTCMASSMACREREALVCCEFSVTHPSVVVRSIHDLELVAIGYVFFFAFPNTPRVTAI